jgi:hypothetical protein
MARKAGAGKEQILNCLPLEKANLFFKKQPVFSQAQI